MKIMKQLKDISDLKNMKTIKNMKNLFNKQKFKKGFLSLLLLAPLFFIASSLSAYADMNSEFKDATSFGQSKAGLAIQDAQSTNPSTVPGYQTSNPNETNYKDADIKSVAKTKVLSDPTGVFVNNSEATRKHETIAKTDSVITNSDTVMKNADKTAQNSAYCSGGDCTDTSYQASPDFNQAVSGLSAAGAGSQDMMPKQVCTGFPPHCTYKYYIFTGQPMSCRIIMLGFSNCCSDDGWGHDVGLAGCNDEEKKLGMKKEAKACHYVGEYCSKSINLVFGSICIEHSKNYCCFNSNLGRIVQEQGRAQLGQGWGSGEHPDCHGFTPQELQKVDFSKIDFSDFYGEIKKEMHVPDVPGTQDHIRNEVDHDINSGNPGS